MFKSTNKLDPTATGWMGDWCVVATPMPLGTRTGSETNLHSKLVDHIMPAQVSLESAAQQLTFEGLLLLWPTRA